MPRCGLWMVREGHREEREEFKDAEKWTVDHACKKKIFEFKEC